MVTISAPKRLALLIDGDNFPPDLAGELFAEVEKLGSSIIRRVYGGIAAMNGWRAMSSRYRIRLLEVLPGKNATDMRLAIDAMDVLHGNKVDGFCIVSSDNDFAELAMRLREDGVSVNGFGGSNAAAGFRRACDSFSILGPAVVAEAPVRLAPVAPQVTELARLLSKAIESAGAGAEGPEISLSAIGLHLRQLKKGFSYKEYGAKNLKTLLQSAKLQVKKGPGGGLIVVLPNPDRRAAA